MNGSVSQDSHQWSGVEQQGQGLAKPRERRICEDVVTAVVRLRERANK